MVNAVSVLTMMALLSAGAALPSLAAFPADMKTPTTGIDADTKPRYLNDGPMGGKGTLLLNLSLPHVNSFHLQPEGESDSKTNTGFWGVGLGLDYYYADNQFINFSASAVTDFFLPVPAAVDLSGEVESMSSVYISLSNNRVGEKFLLGYGISYGRNIWEWDYWDDFDPPPPTREEATAISNALGFVFPIQYKLGGRLVVGLVYRPTFFRVDADPAFRYEHLISVQITAKIRIK